MCHTTAKFHYCEEGLGNSSDKDKKTENAGYDFRDRSTVGSVIETLGDRFLVKVAAIEVSDE